MDYLKKQQTMANNESSVEMHGTLIHNPTINQ